MWRVPSFIPTLLPQELHLWKAAYSDHQARHQDYRALLAADEQARLSRFRFEADQQKYAIGRGLLRTLLAPYLARPAQDIRFAYNDAGKPFLADHPDIAFNLAHAGDLLLLGIRRHAPLGVDVEFIRPVEDMTRLAATYFSPDETRLIASAALESQPALFYRAWVRQEALLKALGQGFSSLALPANMPLQGVFMPSDEADFVVHPSFQDWLCLEFAPDSTAVAAVVTPAASVRVLCFSCP